MRFHLQKRKKDMVPKMGDERENPVRTAGVFLFLLFFFFFFFHSCNKVLTIQQLTHCVMKRSKYCTWELGKYSRSYSKNKYHKYFMSGIDGLPSPALVSTSKPPHSCLSLFSLPVTSAPPSPPPNLSSTYSSSVSKGTLLVNSSEGIHF